MSTGDITRTPQRGSTVRYGRFMSLPRTIALGSSITIGLGIFVLLGFVLDIAGTRSPLSYGLLALLFIPVVLAYAERAIAYPRGRGIFRLGREDDPTWFAYAGDWVGIAGFAGVLALLGWGAGYHLDLLLQRFFSLSIQVLYLGVGMVILALLYRAISSRGTWRTRMRLVYLSAPVMVVIIGLGWFSAGQIMSVRFALRAPGDTVRAVAMLGAILWGLALILNQRDQTRNPPRNLLPALYAALLLGSLSGVAAAVVSLKLPGLQPGNPLPLASVAALVGGLAEAIYLVIGVMVCLIAMDRTIVSGLRLLGSMMQNGYLPFELSVFRSKIHINVGRGVLLGVLCIVAFVLLPFTNLVAVTALMFFAATFIVFGGDLLRPRLGLPGDRRLKLPFHPLVPALAIAVCIYFSLALPREVWLTGLGWALLGILFYFIFARKNSMVQERKTRAVGEEIPREAEKKYRILVDVTGSKDSLSLIRTGIKMAKEGDGQVMVLQVLVQPSHTPVDMERALAGRELQLLKARVGEVKNDSVPVETLVRLSPSRATGVLETVREEKIDLLLVNWPAEQRSGGAGLDAELNRVVHSAPCDVGILRGKIPGPLHTVTVSTRGGPHAGEALKYGQWLAEDDDGKIVAVNIVSGTLTPEKEAQVHAQLDHAIADAGDPESYEARIVRADNVKEGILRESSGSDLLLLGASTRGLLDEAIFDGIPVEVARARSAPTLLVKHYEGAPQFWLRRAWEFIYKPLPTLSVGERREVDRRIRRSALASVDYYTLIVLASVIAILGLIQNSGAVVIGAMLVAPLMSPILALAFSLVLGDGRLLAHAGESTIKGVLVAIVVAAAMALILPAQPITAEILARTQPNLLDLMVALASGAAAAYALARKQLAAALPGVAIAAALVPPLVVVGFGLGYGMFDVAGGALLLFITNLAAIIFSGALVFLLLGFRPTRAEYGQRFQRWILLSVAILLVIAVPLALTTINLRNQLERQQQVKDVLNEVIAGEFAEVEDVTVKPQGDGFLISGTVYAYGDITDEEMIEIQNSLSEAMEAPVVIRARVIQSRLEVVGSNAPPETGFVP